MNNKQHDIMRMAEEYLNGLLTPQEIKYVERKCEESEVWATALREAQKRHEAMEAIPPCEASEKLISDTFAGINRYEELKRPRRRQLYWSVGLAACVALLVLGGLNVWFVNLRPNPGDLRVYGQSVLMADTEASIRVQMFDRKKNQPVSGVPVTISLKDVEMNKTVQLASFKTDQAGSGCPQFRLPDWKDGRYELRVVAGAKGSDEIIQQTVQLIRSWKVMLSTDKHVYQPGQTIHMRILSLRKPDLKPVAGQEAKFSVADSKGNIIFKHTDVTSRFGITSADCKLATEINEGLYTIQATIGDAVSKTSVEVKQYVLPKFTADVELDRAWYEPGQEIHGSVNARYFFGKPVAGGEVHVTASYVDVTQAVFYDSILTFDDQGFASFDLQCPESLVGHEQDSGDARIRLNLKIRDTAGQIIERSLSMMVTQEPVRLTLIPDNGKLVQGFENRIYAFATYPDGKPACVRLAISGLDKEVETSSTGVGIFELTPQTQQVNLTIRATTIDGLSVTNQYVLDAVDSGDRFILRTDKAVYAGGDTVRLSLWASGVQPVFFDLIQDGQTILADSISVPDNGVVEYAFDLPPELSGTIELNAYRFGAFGLAMRQSHVLQVVAADKLSISIETDKSEYRPGEDARLTFRISDANGESVPGALSLSAVDEAVFGVLADRPGMENVFFNCEQEILKPIYALYPWTPDLTSSLEDSDRILLDKAMMAYAGARLGLSNLSRGEILQAMLNRGVIAPRHLDFLMEYDINKLLENRSYPDEFVKLMTQKDCVRMQSSTWPEKERESRLRSARWERIFHKIWYWIGMSMGIVIVAIAAIRIRFVRYALVVLVAGVLVWNLMVPRLARCRESSKDALASASMHALATRFEIMQNEELPQHSPSSVNTLNPTRVRQWFPETLLWKPELITDETGTAQLTLPLADSITSWQLSTSAVSGNGQLGGLTSNIRVFQPFFVDLDLPVALTRGDEVSVPAVVYNYLDAEQAIRIELTNAEGFDLLGEAVQSVTLQPNAVAPVYFRLRANVVGKSSIEIIARSNEGEADAIRRPVEIIPDGRKVESVFNGKLVPDDTMRIKLPAEAIPGSAKLVVKLYPSTFSQLLEGLDGIFRRPYGCFEQTSSTTYPNILALDYLRSTGKSVPEVEAKVREYIHLGYQRLLGFEVEGGGFDWFGRPPANTTLTGYGLLEFQDMAKVYEVDPALIERTRTWLLNHRNSDGSWDPANRGPWHENPTSVRDARLSTTAYIAWAVFHEGACRREASSTLQYLKSFRPDQIQDPYTLALIANAIVDMGCHSSMARAYVRRLISLAEHSQDGKQAYWKTTGERTAFYGRGYTGNVETTALATLALLKTGESHKSANAALTWLTEQRNASGTWGTTQATVLALKALTLATGKPVGDAKPRVLEVNFDGTPFRTLNLTSDQSDVMSIVNLSKMVTPGDHTLSLADRSHTNTGYQVDFSYYVPGSDPVQVDEALSIQIDYDRTSLEVDQSVMATATVVNRQTETVPMAIVDLPIPAGFRADTTDLAAMLATGAIGKFQVTPRSIIVYLRSLDPSNPIKITYQLIATMPVDVQVQPAKVYEYYNPENESESRPTTLHVSQTT